MAAGIGRGVHHTLFGQSDDCNFNTPGHQLPGRGNGIIFIFDGALSQNFSFGDVRGDHVNFGQVRFEPGRQHRGGGVGADANFVAPGKSKNSVDALLRQIAVDDDHARFFDQLTPVFNHIGGDAGHHPHIIHGHHQIAVFIQQRQIGRGMPQVGNNTKFGVDAHLGGVVEDALARTVLPNCRQQHSRLAQAGQVVGHVAGHTSHRHAHVARRAGTQRQRSAGPAFGINTGRTNHQHIRLRRNCVGHYPPVLAQLRSVQTIP